MRGLKLLRRSGDLVLIIFVLVLFRGPADSSGQQPAAALPSLPTLTTAHAVHSLTLQEAVRGYPVHLRAVVTYYDTTVGPPPLFCVADFSGALCVSLSSLPAVNFQPGDLIELSGVSAPGNFAPIMKADRAELLGPSQLPAAAPRVSMTVLLSGAEDGQWVEVEGLVHAVLKTADHVDLQLALSDGALTATTTADANADYDGLVDAKVLVRGNAAPQFNRQRQMTGATLLFPNRAQVVNDILDYSKIEAGKIVLDPAPFNVADLVGETVGSLSAAREP